MTKTIKARFIEGKIEPLESLNLKEGDEFVITIDEERTAFASEEALARAAGAWKETLDFDAYLKDLFAARHEPGRGVSL